MSVSDEAYKKFMHPVKTFLVVLAYTNSAGDAAVWYDSIDCLTKSAGLDTAKQNFEAEMPGIVATDFYVVETREMPA